MSNYDREVEIPHLTLCANIVQSRAGGKVERCHGIPHNGSYNNAAHSWGVAMLLFYLWPDDFPRLSIYALVHDVPEAWVGDSPAPVGRYVPGFKDEITLLETRINHSLNLPSEHDLAPDDYVKLKACDKLEFWLWSREQVAMGNGYAAEGLKEIERYFTETPLPERAQEVYEAMKGRSPLPRQAGIIKELCE
jgi:5'-deoxynucleotidase YfbR-like HD superfamily hydrolase